MSDSKTNELQALRRELEAEYSSYRFYLNTDCVQSWKRETSEREACKARIADLEQRIMNCMLPPPPMSYGSIEEMRERHPLAANCTHLHAFHPELGTQDLFIHNDAFQDHIRGLLMPFWVNGFQVHLNMDLELNPKLVKVTRLPVIE